MAEPRRMPFQRVPRVYRFGDDVTVRHPERFPKSSEPPLSKTARVFARGSFGRPSIRARNVAALSVAGLSPPGIPRGAPVYLPGVPFRS